MVYWIMPYQIWPGTSSAPSVVKTGPSSLDNGIREDMYVSLITYILLLTQARQLDALKALLDTSKVLAIPSHHSFETSDLS